MKEENVTLANESPTQKPGRAARDHADVALKAAAEGRWQEAADANRAVLAFAAEIKVEERIEAQNRLAKCLWELGDLAGSKKEYQVTLTLDPLNRIAERNIERLKGLIKQVGKKTTPSSEGATTPAGIFIQEAGTTGFAHLTNVADAVYLLCLPEAAWINGHTLVAPATLRLMASNHLPGGQDLTMLSRSLFSEATNAGVGFGLGFAVTFDPVRAMLTSSPGEYYWGGAASTAFWIDPVKDIAVVFMTQLMGSSTYPIRRELRTLVYSALLDT